MISRSLLRESGLRVIIRVIITERWWSLMATHVRSSRKYVQKCYGAMSSAAIVAVIMFAALLTRPPQPFAIFVWICLVTSIWSIITLARLAKSLKLSNSLSD